MGAFHGSMKSVGQGRMSIYGVSLFPRSLRLWLLLQIFATMSPDSPMPRYLSVWAIVDKNSPTLVTNQVVRLSMLCNVNK